MAVCALIGGGTASTNADVIPDVALHETKAIVLNDEDTDHDTVKSHDNIILMDNEEIAQATIDTRLTGHAQDCARWVMDVLKEYGINAPYWSGATYWEKYADPTHTIDNIPAGVIVIGTGHNSDTQGTGYHYGHVGISIGDIDHDGFMDIRDCIGDGPSGITISSIRDWCKWQTDPYLGNTPRTPGFVGWVDPMILLQQ